MSVGGRTRREGGREATLTRKFVCMCFWSRRSSVRVCVSVCVLIPGSTSSRWELPGSSVGEREERREGRCKSGREREKKEGGREGGEPPTASDESGGGGVIMSCCC